MAESQHIALYIPTLRVGGAQRVTINIANGLAERGYSVDLLVSYTSEELTDLLSDRITLIDLGTPSIPIAGIGASVLGLRNYLKDVTPSVLISAMTHANVVAILATHSSKAQTEIFATEHYEFGVEQSLKNRLVYLLASHVYPFADHIIAVSEGVAQSIIEGTSIESGNVSVLYNPIEIDEIRRQSKEPLDNPWLNSDDISVIFTVGRIERQKDLPTLLKAFKRVHQQRPDTRLIIAGKGGQRETLQLLSEQLGIHNVVSFPGYVENPFAYMSRAEVFALSSKNEGLPTVLIEALACGCQIVSTDCPSGPREILEDEEYGSLVPVGNPDAFADAILSVLKSPPETDHLFERAKDFSMETSMDRYVRFIERNI